MEQPAQRDIVTAGFLLFASSLWEIYREITDSPETLSAHNMPRGLDPYVRTVVRLKLAHVGWERARIRLEWVKRGLELDGFPGEHHCIRDFRPSLWFMSL